MVNDVATLPYTFTDAGSHSVGASFTAGPGFTDAAASRRRRSWSVIRDQLTTTTVTVPGAAQTWHGGLLEATWPRFRPPARCSSRSVAWTSVPPVDGVGRDGEPAVDVRRGGLVRGDRRVTRAQPVSKVRRRAPQSVACPIRT
ncbi:hypothetical protein GS416_07475 [Rhodococcus hoagii]|nr:hypothetical protein [Prescottella equi]